MNATIIPYPVIEAVRGDLGFLEVGEHVPFQVRRIYYIRDIPPFTIRGKHAHFEDEQLVVVISGSVTFKLDDGRKSQEFILEPGRGALYVPKMTWLEFTTHSLDATCLVLASELYSEEDYINSHEEFLARVLS